MDLIAIDVGNSTIHLAVFAQGKHQRTEIVPLDQADAPNSIKNIVAAFRDLCGPQEHGARTVPVVVSSVNGPGLELVRQAVAEALDQGLLEAGKQFSVDMKVGVDKPELLGPDRLLAAYAAFSVIEDAVVVASFGSATTIDVVNDHGIFLGGVILPGLGLAAQSLKEHTANLPLVEPKIPEGIYGINTETAINNGIFYGAIGTLREMVERYAEELGRWPQVVITGGYGKMIASKCDFADSVVPDLVLDGLFLAYRDYHEKMDSQDDE